MKEEEAAGEEEEWAEDVKVASEQTADNRFTGTAASMIR